MEVFALINQEALSKIMLVETRATSQAGSLSSQVVIGQSERSELANIPELYV